MKVSVDTELGTVRVHSDESQAEMPLFSREAFEVLSQLWVKVGWAQKYSYTFTWLGRPIIQLPEDMVRAQEIIYRVRPDVIVETGVAHGGSLIFYASLCKLLGKGRVIGVDIEIRDHNRKAIEDHPLASYVTLIEGSSTSEHTVKAVQETTRGAKAVLVLLDSNHTKRHVADELELYHHLVTPGSYIVATDGIMAELHDVPGGKPEWLKDNPTEAAREFAETHPEFVLEQPSWIFNESDLRQNVTHWPSAWLRRR